MPEADLVACLVHALVNAAEASTELYLRVAKGGTAPGTRGRRGGAVGALVHCVEVKEFDELWRVVRVLLHVVLCIGGCCKCCSCSVVLVLVSSVSNFCMGRCRTPAGPSRRRSTTRPWPARRETARSTPQATCAPAGRCHVASVCVSVHAQERS